MERPDPTIPEPLWIALSKLSHTLTREDTEPPLAHHRKRNDSRNNTPSPTRHSRQSTYPPIDPRLSSSSPSLTNSPPQRSASPKPALLLLHTAWHTPTCWSRLIPFLNHAGYPVLAPHLPSSGANPPLHNWDPDIDVIRSSITRLARDEGRDVIVLMHAFSGLAGTQALEGLDKENCLRRGWQGGVVRLVYVTAYMFGEGWCQVPPGTADGMDQNIHVDLQRGIYYPSPAHIKMMMYQDVPDEEIPAIANSLVPQSIACAWCTSTYAAWRHIPSTYIITLGDQKATVAAEEWIVKSAIESGRHMVDRVIRREVGHSPFWSQPEWLARVLVEEAERSMVK